MATPSWKKESLLDRGKRYVRMLVRNRRGNYLEAEFRRYAWSLPWVRMPWDYAAWLPTKRHGMTGSRIERLVSRKRYWVPAVGLREYAKHILTNGLYRLLEHERTAVVGEALYRARSIGVAKSKMKPHYEREHRNWRDFLDEDV